jgi:hypothetical protein
VAVATGTTTPVISLIGPYTPSTYAAHSVIVGEGTSSMVGVGPGSSGQILQSGGSSADPAYTTATYPATTTANQLLYSSSANVIGGLTSGNSLLAATNASGVVAMRAFSVNIQTFTSSGTYTPTTGMLYCEVKILGGGGASGGGATTGGSTASAGAGGGAGEYAVGVFSATTIGSSQTVTIGTGGTGVSGAGGNTGGTTSLGALITAVGGSGGSTVAAATAGSAPGGAGGTGGTGGSYRAPGALGGTTFYSVAAGTGYGGQGANSQIGAGGSGGAVNANGNAGSGYGAGGGGPLNYLSQATARTGGAGTAGIVVVTEYIIN